MKNAKDIFMYVLGGLIVAGIFVLIGLLIYRPMPTENKDLLNLTIGALISSFTGVVMYFYGSSRGSSDKNEMIYKSNPPEKDKTP